MARDTRLLHTVAAALEPARDPFYVRNAPGGQPDGWYWKPQGASSSQWLGRNVFAAEQRLLGILRDGTAQAS